MTTPPGPETLDEDDDRRRPMLEALFKATPLEPIAAPIKQEWDRFAAGATPSERGPAALKEGDRFGRYVIKDELGRGGMGIVYRAFDPSLQRTVALKLYGKELAAESETTLERFYQEARATARLGHRGIVRIHDVGREGDLPYLSMDLVDGESLEALLGRLPFEQHLRHIVQVAQALDHAHAHGIVHRDVKPSNIIVDTEGQAVLVDFGVARDLARQTRLTRTGCIVGTVVRMSPEQVQGEPDKIGPMSDVWALGVLLYEAVCGRVPFEGNAAEVLVAILQRDPPWPKDLPPRLRKLVAIVSRCLEKDPGSRYASAGELASELEGFLAGASGSASPPKGKRASAAPRASTGRPRGSEPQGSARRLADPRRARGADTGALRWVAAAALIGAVAFFLLRPSASEGPPPAAAVVPTPTASEVADTPAVAVVLDETPPEIELSGELELPSSERTRSVQGRVSDASPVQLWLDEEPVPVSEDGSFSFESELTDDGLHAFELVARDEAGNESKQELRLWLDTTPPALRVLSPGADPVASAAVTLEGVVEVDRLERLVVDGRPLVPAEDGSFSAQLEFEAEGTREVELEAYDLAGNCARLTQRVTYDATAPTVTLEAPADDTLTRSAQLTVRGQVSDANLPEQVRVSVGSSETSVRLDAEGRFELEVSLPEGRSTLVVECQDRAAHLTSVSRVVVRDSVAPVVTLDDELPTELFGSRARTLVLAGSVDDLTASLTVGGKPAKLSSKGRFRVRLRLSEGENSIEIVAVDPAGNRSELAGVVTYARRRPTAAPVQVLLHEPFSEPSGRGSDKGTLVEAGIVRSEPTPQTFATQVQLADYQTTVVTLLPGAKLRLRYRLLGPTQGSFKLQLWCPRVKDNLSLFFPTPPDESWQEIELDLAQLQTGQPGRPIESVPHACSSVQLLIGKQGESIVLEVDDLLIYVPADAPGGQRPR